MYIMYILNVFSTSKWVYLVFNSVCLMLVYHAYTNATLVLGEWGTGLNIPPTAKQPNISNSTA